MVEHRLDPWLALAVLALLGVSLATLNALDRVMGANLLLRQVVWGGLGLALMWLVSRAHLALLRRAAPVLYGLSLVLLGAVLLAGEMRGGNRAWFALGPLTVQPSEFARVGTLLMVAAWLAGREGRRLSAWEALRLVGIVAIPMAMVLAEPDLGVALTYLPIAAVGLWLGGLDLRLWVVLVLAAVLGAGLAWQLALKPYQKERLLTLVDPERDPYGAGYQVRQSKIAVGSGRLAGAGLGRGTQSNLRFLPAQHTDFVFAAWAEATGFVGSISVLLAYALLLARIAAAATAAEDRHGAALATLVGAWLAFQVLVNIGMVVGWMPTTGITLPLFSYGGSSFLACCLGLGLVQSVWHSRLVNQ